jgi:hypothetical protein
MLLAYRGTEGEANVLDNSHTRGNLHRTRNQRLPVGLILVHAPSCNSPPIHKTAGFVLKSSEGQFPSLVEDSCYV